MNKTNLRIGIVILVLIGAYLGFDREQNQNSQLNNTQSAGVQSETQSTIDDSEKIRQAFQHQQSNVQVQASGRVNVVLADDNDGSRHQKFILKLSNGLTVLVAHNIDLAPRIENLKKDDVVEFYGEYEYNPKGGVIHWTHHDPQQRHIAGWLKYQGKTYQ